MRQYLAKRLLVSIATVLGIVVVVFFIVRVLPGDAAAVRAGPYAGEERIDADPRAVRPERSDTRTVRALSRKRSHRRSRHVDPDRRLGHRRAVGTPPRFAGTRRLRGARRLDCWDSSRNPGCRQGRYRGRQIRSSVRSCRVIDGVVLARSLAHLFLLLHAAVVSRPHRSPRGDAPSRRAGSPASTRSMPLSPGAST